MEAGRNEQGSYRDNKLPLPPGPRRDPQWACCASTEGKSLVWVWALGLHCPLSTGCPGGALLELVPLKDLGHPFPSWVQ